jgi:chromosomal replication initiation ATPase DnaA
MENSLTHIKNSVEKILNVDFSNKKRKQNIVDARIIFFAISRAFTSYRIGIIVAELDVSHCMASYYEKKASSLYTYDKQFKSKLELCQNTIFNHQNN